MTTELRIMQGKVVSDKMEQTIVVKVDRRVKHPVYGKVITRSTKLHAHDPEKRAKMGDYVAIKMCRPISKKKSWILIDVLETETVNVGEDTNDSN